MKNVGTSAAIAGLAVFFKLIVIALVAWAAGDD